MNNGYAPVRRGLLSHVMTRKISGSECYLYQCLILSADHTTGIWMGSAGLAACLFDIPIRTCRDCMEKLGRKGYIKRFMKPGSKESYPILINKYECTEGAVSGMRLNSVLTIDYEKPVYERCSDSVSERSSESAAYTISKKPRINKSKELPSNGLYSLCKAFAWSDFKEREGTAPSWMEKDFVQLAGLVKRKTDLTIDCFKRRWATYVSSTDDFTIKQGMSLSYFCSNFDKFIKSGGQPNGTRRLTGPDIHEYNLWAGQEALKMAEERERRNNQEAPSPGSSDEGGL